MLIDEFLVSNYLKVFFVFDSMFAVYHAPLKNNNLLHKMDYDHFYVILTVCRKSVGSKPKHVSEFKSRCKLSLKVAVSGWVKVGLSHPVFAAIYSRSCEMLHLKLISPILAYTV